jgi:hypothetical protein
MLRVTVSSSESPGTMILSLKAPPPSSSQTAASGAHIVVLSTPQGESRRDERSDIRRRILPVPRPAGAQRPLPSHRQGHVHLRLIRMPHRAIHDTVEEPGTRHSHIAALSTRRSHHNVGPDQIRPVTSLLHQTRQFVSDNRMQPVLRRPRLHPRDHPVDTLALLVELHMPATIRTLTSKPHSGDRTVRGNIDRQRQPVNSHRRRISDQTPTTAHRSHE